MRKLLLCTFCFCICLSVKADHITGGEMYYSYGGLQSGQHVYHFTLKFYMRCNSGRSFNNPTNIAVYERGSNRKVNEFPVALSHSETISLNNPNPCITDAPLVCYNVGYYSFDVLVPPSANGYVVSSVVNYRIAGISNLVSGYGSIGATYTAEIPGTNSLSIATTNTSARFTGSDLVVVCAKNNFSYSFAAEDADGDQLRYLFCEAYVSGTAGVSSSPLAPPYTSVPYGLNYSSSSPLGNNVQINSATGLITGFAPEEGVYVVTVCVQEIRNGVVIATQRKDFQIHIAPCTIAGAQLLPQYMLCKDSKTITVKNLSNSLLNVSQEWNFVDQNGSLILSSTDATVTHTFTDTGTYTIKLYVNRGQLCSDSTTSVVRVYPGLEPGFTNTGLCFNIPINFTDTSKLKYGSINSWDWQFGESTLFDDTSSKQHPQFIYPHPGEKNVRLIITTTTGCIDTAFKRLAVAEKPPLSLAFRDTLICTPDVVKLSAFGNGIFTWTPNVNIVGANTASPTVSPSSTGYYFVELNANGCINRDSVKVNVVDYVTLEVMPDTTICSGDAILLRTATNGFNFSWIPAEPLTDATIANPIATTSSTTTYTIISTIGSCAATRSIIVSTIPYPKIFAGNDTIICHGSSIQLNASSDGSSFIWKPNIGLNSSTILNPITSPLVTTTYVLAAYDTLGCPKPSRDTVVVKVLADINAFAGNDTSVVINQPLQFNATGGLTYLWSPSTNLSATDIPNPVAVYPYSSEGMKYKVLVFNAEGCVDSAFITVKVFSTLPSVFVPTAFTPNGDGKNDVLRPIAAGMQKIEYFNVYNRWGQLVFSTRVNEKGWDGKINGQLQSTGSFLWIVKAVDFEGRPYFEKGMVTLIR